MNSTTVHRHSGLPLLITALIFTALITAEPVHAGPAGFPAPPWLKTTEVADEMVINGLTSQVQYFTADNTIPELLDFYRKHWQDNLSGKQAYKESRAGLWTIISKFDGRYLYTVQVRTQDRFSITGYLAVADIRSVAKNRKKKSTIPKMSGSTILSDSSSRDSGITARTLMLFNTYSAESNSSFYRNYYNSRGWTKTMDTRSQNAFVMTFTKGGKATHLVINHTGTATQVVMNITEKI